MGDDIDLFDSAKSAPPILHRHKLTIPVVSMYIRKGYSQAEIAKLHNVSRQAVDAFVERHREVLADVLQYEEIFPTVIKYNNIIIEKSIDSNDIKKASLLQKRTAVGIGIDKHQLLAGRPTEISAVFEVRPEELDRLYALGEKLLSAMRKDQQVLEGEIEPVTQDIAEEAEVENV